MTGFFAPLEYTGLTEEVRAAVIYGDLVVLLNFLVDLLLLLGTNRLAGFPAGLGRSVAAAGLGGLYAGGCLVPGFQFLGSSLWRLISLAGMGAVAFGWNRSALRRCGVFTVLSLALGGMALWLGRGDFPRLVLSAGLMWLLCRLAFGGRIGGKSYVPVQIGSGEDGLRLTALVDSGNTLRDPVTGEDVVIIGPGPARCLTGLSREQLEKPLETLADRPVPGLRLIPYQTVGQGQGMLLAMRFPEVTVGKRKSSRLVAFAPAALGEGSIYQALTGGSL